MIENKEYWTKIVTKIIKTELAKRDLSYSALVKKLNEIDVPISVQDFRTRMSRGTFSAVLFVQCLKAMGVTTLTLDESYFSRF